MWYLYLLELSDGSIYTGITKDFSKRCKAHAAGKGSKYVSKRLPIALYNVVCLNLESRGDAQRIEHAIKKLSHNQKYLLVNSSSDNCNVGLSAICGLIELNLL